MQSKHQSGFQNEKMKLTHDFRVEFSKKWPEKIKFFNTAITENCAWGKYGKNSKVYLKKGKFPK